jgi:hypothetical protein
LETERLLSAEPAAAAAATADAELVGGRDTDTETTCDEGPATAGSLDGPATVGSLDGPREGPRLKGADETMTVDILFLFVMLVFFKGNIKVIFFYFSSFKFV